MAQFNSDTLKVIVVQQPAAGKGNDGPDYWLWGSGIFIGLLLIIIFRKQIRGTAKKIKPSEYKIEIPGFSISGNVEYYSADQDIAWKIYVEMVTRVTASGLHENDGILREAFNSMYKVFGMLRETLKNAPLDLARPATPGKLTVTSVLIKVMNEHLRPFLSKWHPLLQEHENQKPANSSQSAHEKSWSLNSQCRSDLNELKEGLDQYIIALKEIAEGKHS